MSLTAHEEVDKLSALAYIYEQKSLTDPRTYWDDLLKAHTLYNACDVRVTSQQWKEAAFRLQQAYWGGRVKLTIDEQSQLTAEYREELFSIRANASDRLVKATNLINKWDVKPEKLNKCKTDNFCNSLEQISGKCNDDMKTFSGKLIDKAVELCGKEPCKFAAVCLGSMAKGEGTPYSDIEFLFLVERKSTEDMEYFELLALTVYFLIGNLQETKLKYMNIAELKGFDDKYKNGFKIDGLQRKAGNIPTGNGTPKQKNKFIVTVDELLSQYRQIFDNPDPEESLKGDFTAMLAHTALIYGDEQLIREFERRKAKIIPNKARKLASLSMLKQDITDYSFLPLSNTLMAEHFQSDLKSAIYRYPSILLYNLKIITGVGSLTSWDTLRKLWETDRVSTSYYSSLKVLLATAQYIRMAAYLFYDSQIDRVTFLSGAPKSTSSRDRKLWRLPKPLVYMMSLHMVPVKRDIMQNSSSPQKILNALQHSLNLDLNRTMAEVLFCSGDRAEVIKLLSKYAYKADETLSPTDDLDAFIMIGECHWHCHQWEQFFNVADVVIEILRHGRWCLPDLAFWMCRRACGTAIVGDKVKATNLFEELKTILRQPVEHEAQQGIYFRCYLQMARCYELQYGNKSEVDICMRNAKIILDNSNMKSDNEALYCNGMGEIHIKRHEYAQAEPFLLRAHGLLLECLGEGSVDQRIAESCRSLCKLYLQTGELDKAEDYISQGMTLMRSLHSTELEDNSFGDFYTQLGFVHHAKGNYAESFEAFTKLYQIVEAHYPPVHLFLAYAYRYIGTSFYNPYFLIKARDIYVALDKMPGHSTVQEIEECDRYLDRCRYFFFLVVNSF